MNIHNQFTFNHFIILSIILLIVNFLIFKFKERNRKELFNQKLILVALVLTFLGLFYSEMSSSGDWLENSFGFPRSFYIEKISRNPSAFVKFEIFRIDYLNFIQNFVLFFLLLNLIKEFFKKPVK